MSQSHPPSLLMLIWKGSIIATVEERTPRALVAPTLAVERLMEIKSKNTNEMGAFHLLLSQECALNTSLLSLVVLRAASVL